jgi:hypothetical protein
MLLHLLRLMQSQAAEAPIELAQLLTVASLQFALLVVIVECVNILHEQHVSRVLIHQYVWDSSLDCLEKQQAQKAIRLEQM